MTKPVQVIEHVQEIEIDATPDKVWHALTHETHRWWHPGFFTSEQAIGYHIEPKLGGRVYEDWGDGQGQIWYTVTGLSTGKHIQLAGDMDANYGPARIQTTFRIQPRDGGCTLRLEECLVGRVDESTSKSLGGGWQTLLGGCLKVFAETDAPPAEWPEVAACGAAS